MTETKGPKGEPKGAKVETPSRAAVAGLNLPADLEEFRESFAAALKGPELGAWPEGETFVDATGHAPEKVARALLRTLHRDLPAGLKLGVVWRDGLVVRGASAYAAISRAGGRLAFFTGLQVVLEVDWSLWKGLRPEARLALIDHELHHLAWDVEKDRLGMVGHDVEEFGGIIRRWGLWRPNLVTFAQSGKDQLDLLPDYLIENASKPAEAPAEPPSPEALRDRLRKARGTPAQPTASSKRSQPRQTGSKALRDRAVEPEREDDGWTDPTPPKPDLADLGTLRAASHAPPADPT